jgi:hypothetical protein
MPGKNSKTAMRHFRILSHLDSLMEKDPTFRNDEKMRKICETATKKFVKSVLCGYINKKYRYKAQSFVQKYSQGNVYYKIASYFDQFGKIFANTFRYIAQ